MKDIKKYKILNGTKISFIVSAMLCTSTLVIAHPSGGVITSGNATITNTSNTTQINQTTNKASISWDKFSIGKQESVVFNQPSTKAIILNRVVGNEKSIIDGSISANGQVWILNANGILFNKDAKVSTSGLLATTSSISDDEFISGKYSFANTSQNSIINDGQIDISNSGYATLFAKNVQNSGTIKAIKGTIELVGADKVSINLNGNSLVSLTVQKGILDALVENSGAILADGGQIYLTTNSVDSILKSVVNNTGIIEANSINDLKGSVEIFAHNGVANISGSIIAKDGFVETSAEYINISDSFSIKAKDWLIDPLNVTIEASGSTMLTSNSISATALQDALQTTNVTLQATNDININQALTYNANTLRLIAGNNINVNSTVNITDNASMTLSYINNLNFGLNLINQPFSYQLPYKLNFAGSGQLKINNHNYTILSNDIDFRNASDTNGYYAVGSDFTFTNTPLSMFGGSSFGGSFEGLGHELKGLYSGTWNSTNMAGLFASTTASAKIGNISLRDGVSSGSGIVGVLVGTNYGTIKSSIGAVQTNNSATTQSDNVAIGGLVGINYGDIISSVGIGSTYGPYNNGGLAGINYGNITSCVARSSVATSSNANSLGGLVGTNYGNISSSFAYGFVGTGLSLNSTYITSNIGGLVGTNNGTIASSFSYSTTAYVTGDTNVGGLVGYNGVDGVILSSYSTKKVQEDTDNNPNSNYGGLIGLDDSNGGVTQSYWDTQTTTQSSSAGGSGVSGKTTSEIQDLSILADMGFDVVEDSTISSQFTTPVAIRQADGSVVWKVYKAGTTVRYAIADETIGYGDLFRLPSPTFTGLSQPLYTQMLVRVYDIDGNDVTNSATSGSLAVGTYDMKVVSVDSPYTIASSGNTIGKLTIQTPITVTYTIPSQTIAIGEKFDSSDAIFAGGTPSNNKVVIKVYDSQNQDVTTSATNGTLSAGTYTTKVTEVGSGYTLANNGNTNGTLIIKAPISISYSIQNETLGVGDTYGLPNPKFTGGTPNSNKMEIKVYDNQNQDVTTSATNGTLSAGTYTVKVSSVSGGYTLASSGNTDGILTVKDATTLTYSIKSETIGLGDTYGLPTPKFDGGQPSSNKVVVKVYNNQNQDVTDDAQAGLLDVGTYSIKVVDVGSGYTLASSGNTNGTLTIKSPSIVSYKIENFSIQYSDDFELPLASFVGGKPSNNQVEIKVFDSQNVDVTNSAQAGLLNVGTYSIKVTQAGGGYILSPQNNIDGILTINKKNLSYTMPNQKSQKGDGISLPTPIIENNQDIGNIDVMVYDKNGANVTADAIAGNLEIGKYYIKAIGNNNSYELDNGTKSTLIVSSLSDDKIMEKIRTKIANNGILVQQPHTIIPDSASTTKDSMQVSLVTQSNTVDNQRVVTLDEIKSMSNEQNIVVKLSTNSVIDIVNGGVMLPTNVSQQFYVEETK